MQKRQNISAAFYVRKCLSEGGIPANGNCDSWQNVDTAQWGKCRKMVYAISLNVNLAKYRGFKPAVFHNFTLESQIAPFWQDYQTL